MLELPDKPCEAVFISDLHLDPEEPEISARFDAFIKWAALHAQSVYILGDFFHAWAGDDQRDAWSDSIAKRLRGLSEQGVSLYYMHGNRDFLLGRAFAEIAGLTILPEPTVIHLEKEAILLVHGDRYCTQDRAHQWFRRLTRNAYFARIFLNLPLQWRLKMVRKLRQLSQRNGNKTEVQMDVVAESMLAQMRKYNLSIVIHGHTHKPGLRNHLYNNTIYHQYVLSDWDEEPQLLCYHKTKGLYFNQYPL